VGVVAALAAEARALGPAVGPAMRPAAGRAGAVVLLRNGALMAVSGMGAAAAGAAAVTLLESGASALMSFGLAGGLDPALPAGSMVLPAEVITRSGAVVLASAEWRGRVSAALQSLGPVCAGKLLTSARAVGSVADKAAAFRDTGAAAVDMESLAIAQVAAARGVPFVAVRVIVDTAADELPQAVMSASASGQVHIWRLLGALARDPAELGALIRLAGRYRTATRRLAAVARAALPASPGAQVRAA
jgi:adenosylhomocysteine nucleosidase